MKPIFFKKLNKKGFTYLVSVIIIIILFISAFLLTSKYQYQDKQEVENFRIITMNDFVRGFNEDISRAMTISAHRSLVGLEEYTTTKGEFLDDTEEAFKEVFYSGTYNGTEIAIMNSSDFQDYLNRTNTLANKLGITTQVNVTNITLNQSTPWAIDVFINTQINITDIKNIASWHYEQTFFSQVSILNLRDPLYGVFTDNKIPNTIRKYNDTILVTFDNDTTNLVEFINDSYYIASDNAPNFLMRFENNLTDDVNGIESIVNVQKLSDQEIDVYPNRVKIDHIYFNELSSTKRCNFQNVPSELKFVIPDYRLTLYQVNSLNYSLVCP